MPTLRLLCIGMLAFPLTGCLEFLVAVSGLELVQTIRSEVEKVQCGPGKKEVTKWSAGDEVMTKECEEVSSD